MKNGICTGTEGLFEDQDESPFQFDETAADLLWHRRRDRDPRIFTSPGKDRKQRCHIDHDPYPGAVLHARNV
jgi:hypothetical protein